jgi:hypothetical protein
LTFPRVWSHVDSGLESAFGYGSVHCRVVTAAVSCDSGSHSDSADDQELQCVHQVLTKEDLGAFDECPHCDDAMTGELRGIVKGLEVDRTGLDQSDDSAVASQHPNYAPHYYGCVERNSGVGSDPVEVHGYCEVWSSSIQTGITC